MNMYQNQRVFFDRILKKYNEYVELYKEFNGGSLRGVTPFEEFYWRFSYYVKYSDSSASARNGY